MKEIIANREEEILEEIMNLSRINALSGNEYERIKYMQKSFKNKGITNTVIDCAGNLVTKIDGKSDEYIVIVAHADNFEAGNGARLTSDKIIGKNIFSSLALYSQLLLGELLSKERLHNSVCLVTSVEGLTTLNGIRFFIDSFPSKIISLIDLRGSGYGRISTSTEALARLRIEFNAEAGSSQKTSPIFAVNSFINKLKEDNFFENIAYNIGEISCGNTYWEIPSKGYMKLELKSYSLDDINEAIEILRSISIGISKENRVSVSIFTDFVRNGIDEKTTKTEEIIFRTGEELQLKLSKEKWNTEIVYPVTKHIDSISIGLGIGGRTVQKDEYLEIKSIMKGLEFLNVSVINIDKDI